MWEELSAERICGGEQTQPDIPAKYHGLSPLRCEARLHDAGDSFSISVYPSTDLYDSRFSVANFDRLLSTLSDCLCRVRQQVVALRLRPPLRLSASSSIRRFSADCFPRATSAGMF